MPSNLPCGSKIFQTRGPDHVNVNWSESWTNFRNTNFFNVITIQFLGRVAKFSFSLQYTLKKLLRCPLDSQFTWTWSGPPKYGFPLEWSPCLSFSRNNFKATQNRLTSLKRMIKIYTSCIFLSWFSK